jgi:hypothetical protein
MTVAKPLNVSTETTPDRAIDSGKLGNAGSISNDLGPVGTAQRAFGVTYNNSSGRLMLVVVTITCTPSPGQTAIYTAYESSNSFAEDEVAKAMPGDVNSQSDVFLNLVFLVPAGFSYHVEDEGGGGFVSEVYRWFEYQL